MTEFRGYFVVDWWSTRVNDDFRIVSVQLMSYFLAILDLFAMTLPTALSFHHLMIQYRSQHHTFHVLFLLVHYIPTNCINFYIQLVQKA